MALAALALAALALVVFGAYDSYPEREAGAVLAPTDDTGVLLILIGDKQEKQHSTTMIKKST